MVRARPAWSVGAELILASMLCVQDGKISSPDGVKMVVIVSSDWSTVVAQK